MGPLNIRREKNTKNNKAIFNRRELRSPGVGEAMRVGLDLGQALSGSQFRHSTAVWPSNQITLSLFYHPQSEASTSLQGKL